MGRRLAILFAISAALLAYGCERCSGPGGGGPDPAAGLPPAVEPRPEAPALPFEAVVLGADQAGFLSALGRLADIAAEDLATRVTCAPLSALDIIEPDGENLVERTRGGHALEGCALFRAGSESSSPLTSVRGGFVDGRLASVSFSFPAEQRDRLLSSAEDRFGPAIRRPMMLRTALGAEPLDALLWNVDGAAWLLLPGERTVTLVHQDPRAAAGLGRPAPVPARGEPVSLDDIGLGGALDLDSPVTAPDLAGLRALLGAADAGDGGDAAERER
jgi:hypothetical protein